MEVENQEGQGPLWAVVPLMMMMVIPQNTNMQCEAHTEAGPWLNANGSLCLIMTVFKKN
jgi:hypothetical protein